MAAWVTGHDVLIMVNGFLTLNVDIHSERSHADIAAYDLAIEVPTRRISVIARREKPAFVKALQWNSQSRQLISTPLEVYGRLSIAIREDRGQWKEVEVGNAEAEKNPVEMILEQDLNTAPKLVAVNTRSKQREVLLDLNPQFTQLRFGRVEAIQWNATDGHQMMGALYYPPYYIQGTRYPL